MTNFSKKNKSGSVNLLAVGLPLILAAFVMSGCNSLQGITVNNGPTKTVYGQGQELDTTGLAVTAHYKKNDAEAQKEALTISGYDKSKTGNQTITVTMKQRRSEFTGTFAVTVIPAVKISIQKLPDATVFMQGDEFNPSGLTALVEFEGDTIPDEEIGPDRLVFSGYDKDKGGVQNVTADYYGQQATFEVTVAELSKIEVTSPPNNTKYFIGEDLVINGIVVTGTWENGTTKRVTINQKNVSGYDKNLAGQQDVLVTYSGKTATFPVTNIALQTLTVTKMPDKLVYSGSSKDKLDLKGLAVQGRWQDGTESIDINRLNVSGFDPSKSGEQYITLAVGGANTSFKITIAYHSLTITINNVPSKYDDNFGHPNLDIVWGWSNYGGSEPPGTFIRTFGGMGVKNGLTIFVKDGKWRTGDISRLPDYYTGGPIDVGINARTKDSGTDMILFKGVVFTNGKATVDFRQGRLVGTQQ